LRNTGLNGRVTRINVGGGGGGGEEEEAAAYIPVAVNPMDTINVRLYRSVQLYRWKRKRREGIKKC